MALPAPTSKSHACGHLEIAGWSRASCPLHETSLEALSENLIPKSQNQRPRQPQPESRAELEGWRKTSLRIRAPSARLGLGSSLWASAHSSCQHSRCWQPDKRLHLVCVKIFFFPEELVGFSVRGSSPRTASGSNGNFLLAKAWGLLLSLLLHRGVWVGKGEACG